MKTPAGRASAHLHLTDSWFLSEMTLSARLEAEGELCVFSDQVGSRADPLEDPSFSTVGKGENLTRSLATYQV